VQIATREGDDLHMLQAARGATFPMVTVRTKVPESGAASGATGR